MEEEKETIEGEEDTEKTFEDKTSENEEEKKDEKEKPKNSYDIQKSKYREKLKEASSKVSKLEAELAELRSMVKKPTDDAEARAQEYIRSQAKAVFEELQSARKSEEEKTKMEFKEKVDEVLEDNPDISEEELLEAVEEYEVEPKVALKILKKISTSKSKPKMPQSKRASEEEPKEKPDDSKKTMWEIAREEMAKLKK